MLRNLSRPRCRERLLECCSQLRASLTRASCESDHSSFKNISTPSLRCRASTQCPSFWRFSAPKRRAQVKAMLRSAWPDTMRRCEHAIRPTSSVGPVGTSRRKTRTDAAGSRASSRSCRLVALRQSLYGSRCHTLPGDAATPSRRTCKCWHGPAHIISKCTIKLHFNIFNGPRAFILLP